MKNEENILKELWLGNIYPLEQMMIKPNTEIDKLAREVDSLHFIIADKIKNENLFDEFNKYEKAHGRYEEAACEQAFELGFSLATKLFCASFNKES